MRVKFSLIEITAEDIDDEKGIQLLHTADEFINRILFFREEHNKMYKQIKHLMSLWNRLQRVNKKRRALRKSRGYLGHGDGTARPLRKIEGVVYASSHPLGKKSADY